MDPIQTTSGKTVRANLKVLRAQRAPPAPDDAALLIEKLDAMTKQLYKAIPIFSDELNTLRLLAIDARQLVKRLRNRPDIEV